MIRGERPIKVGDIWFFAKSISVDGKEKYSGVEHFAIEGSLTMPRF